MAIAVARTVILYTLLMVAMRVMGKRQLGELQPSELAVTLLLSDLAAVPMQENGIPLLNGILPILVLISLELLVSGLMLKYPGMAKAVSGTPIPIIRDGRVDEKAMRKLRLTVEDLIEALRQQNIFDIRQVQYAIAETNGHISAFCYQQYQAATVQDVSSKREDNGMPVVIISDGQCSTWGLSLCGFDENWVKKTLKRHHCTQKDVFLLTATKTGDTFLLKTKDVLKQGGTG